MSSIREQIVLAAVSALGGAGKPAGVPSPVRCRIDSPDADQLPALSVYQLIEKVDPERAPRSLRASRGPIVRRYLDLAVEVLSRSEDGTDADAAADPALVWASQALQQRSPAEDPEGDLVAFGDLAEEIDELGTKFEYDRGETAFCRATLTFRIQYQTLTVDPEQTE